MFPHDPEAMAASDGGPLSPSRASGSGDRRTILLIEDHEPDRDIYGSLLWYNGYDVVHAIDGSAGLELARAKDPALVLLDLTLPGMTGLEVCRRLRAMGLDVPIVILSAHPEADMGTAARKAGADSYLEKPIDPFMVVREVMSRVGRALPDEKP